jgi:dienelactone hydrolase
VGISLPTPTGADSVGVVATGVRGAVVYFPAQPGTGSGHLPYVGQPGWASLAGLDPSELEQVTPTATAGATPKTAAAARPVVILLPGWRSLIAFSTSLAEDLASHGYVVIAAQTDIAAESTHSRTTAEDRAARGALFRQLLTLVATPEFAALVGPVDAARVAIGGHSYAGAIALDVALADRRVAAVVDIDGGARVAPTRPVANRPTLLLASVDESGEPDHDLGAFAARSPNTVSVGITQALHMDLTDAALMPQLLGNSVFAPLIGRAKARGPADTAVVVRRFLDSTLSATPHLPTPRSLVSGMDGTTTNPYSA